MRRQIIAAALCAILVAGCDSTRVRPHQVLADRFEPWSDQPIPYRFEDGDELDIKLMYNPEFSDRVVVNPDGLLHLQLVGAVQAGGKTPEELAGDLRTLYAKELRRPDVAVVPRAFYSQNIYVGGEVLRPGLIAFKGRTDLLQAVILAGGFTSLARTTEVVLIRRTDHNTPMLKVVNVRRIIEGDFKNDVEMRRYDVVYVPRSRISETDQFIDQYINQILPFQRSFNYTITNGTTKNTQ